MTDTYKQILQDFLALPGDYRGEAVAAELIQGGALQDKLYFRTISSFKRPAGKDIAAIKLDIKENGTEQLLIELNREGLYDMLPEGIFHFKDVRKGKGKEVILEDIKKAMDEERQARKFFGPFENEFFQLRLQLELKKRALLQPIAPPAVIVTAVYPGANAETVLRSVAPLLEESINGVENMSYMSSTASNDGSVEITVFFKQGTNPDQAAVNVQNRVTQATSQLPAEVVQQGIKTAKQQNGFIEAIGSAENNRELFETVFADATLLNNHQLLALLYLLPMAHRIRGDIEKIAFCISILIRYKTNVTLVKMQVQHQFEGETGALGGARLGINTIAGSSFSPQEICYNILISDVEKENLVSFFPGGVNLSVIKYIAGFLFPADSDYSIELQLKKGDREAFLSGDKKEVYLGFNSYI